jgi:hypothetical protein
MAPRTSGCPYRAPSRCASTAHGRPRAPGGRSALAGTHRSARGTPAPRRAPDMSARPPERSGQRRSAPRASSSCRRASGSRPRGPAAGNSSPTRVGSRACTGSRKGPVRTPRSTARQRRQHPPIGLPNGPLGDLKRLRLRLAHPTPPARRRLIAKPARTTRPLRSSPITEPSTLIRDGPPLCPAQLLSPSQFPLLGVLAWDDRPQATPAPLADRPVGATGSRVPHESPDHARATFTPDTAWPINRHPPGSSQSNDSTLVSMSPIRFRRLISGSLSLAFVIHT